MKQIDLIIKSWKGKLLLIPFVFLFGSMSAQFCSTPTQTVPIAPSASSQTTSIYSSGIICFTFNATSGCSYSFATCGLSTQDTYLRLYSGLGVTLLTSSDDYCSTQSQITWTCPSTGVYSMLLSQYSCASLGGNAAMSYSSYCAPTCAGSPAAANVVASQTLVCPNGSSALSLSTTYTALGITYQWYSAPALAGPYTAIPNATLSTYLANSLTVSTFYNAVITCSSGPASTTATPIAVNVAGTTTNTVPYFEGFEGISVSNQLPNCSWAASNLPTICQTYTAPQASYNRIPNTGSKFASFRYGTNAAGDYFYTNGIQLNAGTTYSASSFYIADGLTGWTEYSMWYGTSQSTAGLVNIASVTGNIVNTTYSQLNGNFTVPTTGIYYIAIKAVGTSNPWYLSWDDLSITVVPTCTVASGGTVSPTSMNGCSGQVMTLTSTGASIGTGIVYQWMVSGTPGGPYSNVTGGNGATTTSYTTAPLTAGTYYYVLQTTCTTASLTGTSNEATITINPVPSVSVSPTTGTICLPGGVPVALNASGATTYSWLPVAGLSSTTGISVNAIPASSTIYTVSGANSFGCIGTATTSVTISEAPSIFPTTASPSLICSGASSTLQTAAALTSSYVINNIPYAPVVTPSTGVTVLCNNGSATIPLSSGTLDDGGWSNLSIPFTFNFFGNSYNTYAVSTNGFICLGSGNPNTYSGYSNSLPYTFAAKPVIGASYADLDFDGVSSGSTIQYFVTGATPNQKLVVNWSGQFYNNTGTVTTQAIIYETSNIIEVHTFTSTGTNAAVEGIQDPTATTAYVVSGRNAVNFTVSTPDAYQWAPAGGPVTYNWSPSTFLSSSSVNNPVANAVTATTPYTVTVTAANGCTASASTIINVNTPSISVAGTSSICTGGTVNLTASGANTYTWSTTANTASITDTPTASTVYSVSGTNSVGCVANATQSVTVNATPTLVIGTSTLSVCAGNTVNIGVTGASTYTWSTGSNGTSINPTVAATTNYSVTGDSGSGCTSTASVTINANANPTVNATSSASLICAGQSATLTASGATTYSWNTTSTNTAIAVSPTTTTSYSVTGSDVNGCMNTFVISQAVSPCTGVSAKSVSSIGILVYPNPNTGEFTVELNNGAVKTIELTDLTGRVIMSATTSDSKTDFNINTLANGVYFVKVQSNNSVDVIKVVKQ